jgi:hypothetical protein
MSCVSTTAHQMPPKWSAPERAGYSIHFLENLGIDGATRWQGMAPYDWFLKDFKTFRFPSWKSVGVKLCSVFEIYFNQRLRKSPGPDVYGSLVLQELFHPCVDKVPGIGKSSPFHDSEVFDLYREFFRDPESVMRRCEAWGDAVYVTCASSCLVLYSSFIAVAFGEASASNVLFTSLEGHRDTDISGLFKSDSVQIVYRWLAMEDPLPRAGHTTHDYKCILEALLHDLDDGNHNALKEWVQDMEFEAIPQHIHLTRTLPAYYESKANSLLQGLKQPAYQTLTCLSSMACNDWTLEEYLNAYVAGKKLPFHPVLPMLTATAAETQVRVLLQCLHVIMHGYGATSHGFLKPIKKQPGYLAILMRRIGL